MSKPIARPKDFTLKQVLFLLFVVVANSSSAQSPNSAEIHFDMERTVARSGFDGDTCWVHARAGAIPPESQGNDAPEPLVVMTMQKLLLSGSDVFYALNESHTTDGGSTWTDNKPQPSFERQIYRGPDGPRVTGASIAPELLREGDETTVCDFSPQWHAASGRLLGLGQSVWYRENRVMKVRPRGIAYAVYDAKQQVWKPWKVLQLPPLKKFQSAGAGSVQRVDLPGGDSLIPFYFKAPEAKEYSVTVCRCRFDGEDLEYISHGSELTIPVDRGLYEPSLTRFQNKFYLTMRNDQRGYVSVSDDGLHFSDPTPWTFDDGADLGNYNTQQHWVTHSDALFLVYTRRGAENDHVFRHRAPLFIAQVDTESLTVIRASEQIIAPERGARLGNFGVVRVSPEETWITAAEWMQPEGVSKHGSDNSVFIAKLKWRKPNRYFGSTNAPAADSTGAVPADERWQQLQPYFAPPEKWKDQLGDYRSPLMFDDGNRVESPEDWRRRRQEIYDQWQKMLGKWPPLMTSPTLETLSTERRGNVTQHRVRFQWTPQEYTTGYLLIPDGPGPHPGVVTVFYEPETAIGRGSPYRDFAWQLANRGFVALSIGTTEASQAKTYALYHPSLEDAQVQPLSMLAYAAANAWHVLASRPEVDSNRIGIAGHSFGGKWAMFAACLFDKFACAAWSDPGIVFDEARPSVNYWEPWYLGYHPKPWRPRGLISDDNPARGLYPRLVQRGHDLHELHALMAPRPFLVSGGSEDPLERWQALNHTIAVNRVLGRSDRVAMTNRPDHSPNEDSNEILYTFFEHFLAPTAP